MEIPVTEPSQEEVESVEGPVSRDPSNTPIDELVAPLDEGDDVCERLAADAR